MSFVSCENCPLRALEHFADLTRAELEFVSALKSDEINLPAGAQVIEPGQVVDHLCTLLAGWALRYRLTESGERKVLEILLPGSLIGLQNLMHRASESGVVSLTPVTLCVLGGARFSRLFEDHPALARGLIASIMEDQRRADVKAMLNAKLPAAIRLGHLFIDSFDRLAELGRTQGDSCYFPLQRRDLADALGLSETHVSRSATELHERGLATLKANSLTIHSQRELADFAGYRVPRRDGRRFLL